MRLNQLLLAAAVALVTVSAATENRQVKHSAETTPDAVQLVEDIHERRSTRFLRFREEVEERGDLNSANEERKISTDLTKQLSKVISLNGGKVDDILTAAQSSKITKVEDDLMASIKNDPIASQYVNQFIKDNWDSELLKITMKITPATNPNSKEYQAFKLLLRLRDYESTMKMDDIGQKLMGKVVDDDLAKKFFGKFVEQNWPAEKLRTEMGIPMDAVAGSAKLNSYSVLLQSRMYFDTVIKSTTPAMRKEGQSILAQVDENPLAQKYFGQFMDDTLSQEALRTALGLKPGGSMKTKEFETALLLIQAKAFNSNFDNAINPKTIKEKLWDQVNSNQLASNFYTRYMTEKWSAQKLKTQLDITKNTAVTSSKYGAYSALLKNRLYVETVTNAKNPSARKIGEDMMTKLDENKLAQEHFGEFMIRKLTQAELKEKLGITRTTPKTSEEYKAWFLLVQLRAISNGLNRL